MVEKRQHRQATAETMAIEALAFLAGRPEELARFLDLSGILPERIRAAAAESGFLAAVLDHISSDEALLLSFAADGGFAPASVSAAREALANARA